MFRSGLLLVFMLTCGLSFSQRLHIGVFGGVGAYNGDLASALFPKNNVNPALAGTLSFELTDNLLLRGQLSYTVVGAEDRFQKQADLRTRNLSFESRIYEAALMAEYHLFNLYDNRWTPYIFVGAAVYHHNPYTFSSNGTKVYLRPLRTEGQGLPGFPPDIENNYQWAIPVGGGVKFALTDDLQIGLELGLRKLFTDYLDDVSTVYPDENELRAARGQRAVDYSYRGDELPGGDPLFPSKGATRGGADYKDLYYLTGLHISYRLNFSGNKRYSPGGAKNPYKCPPSLY